MTIDLFVLSLLYISSSAGESLYQQYMTKNHVKNKDISIKFIYFPEITADKELSEE